MAMSKSRRQARKKRAKRAKRNRRQEIQEDVLPDDILLEIFDFYMDVSPSYEGKADVEKWHTLAHVCRQWRSLVLGSPRRWNLRLYCTPNTPAKDTLDVLPALPLIIRGKMASSSDADNVIAALGQSNRVCEAALWNLVGRQLEEVLAAMQVPFPELRVLRLFSDGKTQSVVPDSFLDGSAPRLRIFESRGIPFPGLPNLLLSSTHLTQLGLANIPHSGYFPPEAIVALLSVLSSLETLSLEFQSLQSRPGRESRRPPPSERFVIPALTCLYFKGATEYLEDLVTGIDAPRLDKMHVTFFNQTDFDIPQLAQFINRTHKTMKRNAVVEFDDNFAHVGLLPRFSTLEIKISCKEPDLQVSSIEQVCNSSLHPLSTVEDLYIQHGYQQLVWKNNVIPSTLWSQLLLPFTAVKRLYLFNEFAPGIAAALKGLTGGRITEVLPSLQDIFVERLERSGSFRGNIRQFVAARQLSNLPITISDWESY